MTTAREPDRPLHLSRVLAEEYEALHKPLPADLRQAVARAGEQDMDDVVLREKLYSEIHKLSAKRSALCFSGGGIRSATFNLGVIQALAKLHLLDKFDYLSTVSGGGYIGGWLTAWIHRSTPDGAQDRVEGVTRVARELRHNGANTASPRAGREPTPLYWLREYSNYLTPKIGLFSADSWTMLGIGLRNLILNWLVLIPLLLAGFMIPRLQIAWVGQPGGVPEARAALWGGLLLAVPALTYLHAFRPSFQRYRRRPLLDRERRVDWDYEKQGWFLFLHVLPLLVSAYCLTTAWAWFRNAGGALSGLAFDGWSDSTTFAVTGAGLHLIGWLVAMLLLFVHSLRDPQRAELMPRLIRRSLKEVWVIGASGALGGWALWAVLYATPSEVQSLTVSEFREWYAVFGVPGFLGLFLLVATLFIGLAGRSAGDQDQEWWGRTGSWVLNAGTMIAAIGALIVFGPGLLAKAGAWTSASVGSLAGFLSLVGGFSGKTLLRESDATDRLSRLRDLAVKLATPLFVMMLIALFALGTSAMVKGWSWLLVGPQGVAWVKTGALMPEADAYQPSMHSLALHNAGLSPLLSLWGGLLATGLFMGWFVNVNKFSLHGFYRNRLIRAYLGASRAATRTPNLLTGFDDNDNLQLRELANRIVERPGREPELSPRVLQKPFHVVNIALNLTRGDNLAWQQRKAQSFTASPLHCGSWQDLGYRSSERYGYNKNVGRAITLGTAVATSGAAASPNMGYHSSAAVAFLLALFNIRLGWWLGNPGEAGGARPLGAAGAWLNLRPAYNRACPDFSIGPLLAELFGFTTARYRYVYLSDGGHFENLGLYEMVLRRCHHIVVVDAGCDQAMSFEDLGNAIRKIRIDQGVEIEIDVEMLRPQDVSGRSRWHHAIGTIRYDKVDEGAPAGTLLYLKPSLTGKESTDVHDYAAQHRAFPHEPTSDQFFDEAQFESYRRLGEHIAWEVFRHGVAPASSAQGGDPFSDVIDRIEKYWGPAPPQEAQPS